jgi:hypothetical protein
MKMTVKGLVGAGLFLHQYQFLHNQDPNTRVSSEWQRIFTGRGEAKRGQLAEMLFFASPRAMKGSCIEGETGEEGRGKQILPGKFDYFRLAPAVKRSFSDFVGTDEWETLPYSRMQPARFSFPKITLTSGELPDGLHPGKPRARWIFNQSRPRR